MKEKRKERAIVIMTVSTAILAGGPPSAKLTVFCCLGRLGSAKPVSLQGFLHYMGKYPNPFSYPLDHPPKRSFSDWGF